ncbi:MAG: outer membrane beta-barrel family protein, partial [Bacteroidota bacterium]
GVKTIIRRIISQSAYEAFDTLANDYLLDPTRSNDFTYDQDVFAGYASFNVNLGKKYSFVAGARYEWTEIAGESVGENDAFSFNYGNLLPSIILSRKLKQFSTLKLSFNQRIRRPSLFFINPFVNAADSRNITVGNPELNPELTDQVELGYTTILKGVTLNAAVFFRQTRDVIEQIFTVDEFGRSVGTYLNVGTNQSIGLDVFSSWTIKKIWTLRGGFNLYTYDATGVINGKQVSNTGFLYRINANSSLQLKYGLRLEAFGFFNSPRITLQGTRQAFSIYNFGIKKSLWKKKGSIGATVTQPFSRFQNFGSELNGIDFYQSTDFLFPFRSFGVNFSYRFGKQTFKRRRRSKVRNDDQKAGETSNF